MVAVAQLCAVDGQLVGDLDRDGAAESFPLEAFTKPGVIDGVAHPNAGCPQPRFAWFGNRLGADRLDVLGATDLDRDGHFELLIAYRPADGPRTVALYTPIPGPVPRLERRATAVR